MAIDKKITDLNLATNVNGNDVSILARAGTDYQFSFSSLLQYIAGNSVNGASINFGSALPQNNAGKNGDLFIRTTDNTFAQKVNGNWVIQYHIESGTGNSLRYGFGAPAADTGNNLDTYISTATGIFYQKVNNSWVQVFSMQTGPVGPAGAKGDTGAKGSDGTALLNGEGDPSNQNIGKDGDFYLNTIAWKIFGPKTNGNWGNGTILNIDTSTFATASDLQNKVDKVLNKQLSDFNFSLAEKTKLDSLSDHYKGKYVSLSELTAALPTGTAGDYAIVTASPHDEEYIWDSNNSTWVLTQNVPASTFEQLGGNPTDNTALNYLITDINTGISNNAYDITKLKSALVVHPTYNRPFSTLSSPQSAVKYEVGQTRAITLNLDFTQKDAGTAIKYSIKKGGVEIVAANTYTDNVVMGITPVQYQGSVTYNAGPSLKNNFGENDPTGQIAAGNTDLNTLSFQGYYAIRYDAVPSAVLSSAGVRGFSNWQLTINGNSFTLNTGTVYKIFQFWVPNTKTLISVIDQDALNANITGSYIATNLSVEDAGGIPVAGKLYTMTNAVTYSTSHRHLITVN